MSSTAPSCNYCNRVPAEGEAVLSRCARCRDACYCNQDYQRRAWRVHKHECQSTPVNTGRTNMMMSLATMRAGQNMSTGAQDPLINPDTIYYLRTTNVALKDISILGPFYPLDTVVLQIESRMLREGSIASYLSFKDILGQASLAGIMRASSTPRLPPTMHWILTSPWRPRPRNIYEQNDGLGLHD